MRTFIADLVLAYRGFWKSPGFTLAAVLTLALGVGANTAVFHLVDRMLLRPLPLPEAHRLVAVTERNAVQGGVGGGLSYPNFLDYRRENGRLQSMAVAAHAVLCLTGDGEAERLRAERVSCAFLGTLGVVPALGRDFCPEDDREGSPRVAILGHGLWMRRFGGDAGVLGRSLRLDGEAVQVVGVLPPGGLGGVVEAELLVPLALPKAQAEARGARFLACVGRLRPGVSLAEARQDLARISEDLGRAHPSVNLGSTAEVASLQERLTRHARPTLMGLFAAVGLVLLIACVNVANLLLARGAARGREWAVRAALGADRRRLVLQGLAESLALALIGSAAGLMLAQALARGLRTLLGFRLPDGGGLLDGRMLVFAAGAALATALAFGVLPALQASRVAPGRGIGEGAKGSEGPSHARMRGLLVGAEVALATLLLAGAGLMLRSMWKLHHVDPGFRSERLLVASLQLPKAKYPDGRAEQLLERRLLARLCAIPGVRDLALNDTPPLAGSTSSSGYQLEGEPAPRVRPMAICHQVSPGYLRAMGMPLLGGRDLQPMDSRVVVASAAFARRHGGDALLGRRLSLSGDAGPWMTVVGVTGDVHQNGLAEAPDLELYLPLLDPAPEVWTRIGGASLSVLLRTEGAPERWKAPVKAALRELDPELPVRLRSMEDLMALDLEATRVEGALLGAFSLVALLLAALGVYGVTAFLVARRRRELGIRMALGARGSQLLRQVLGEGMRPVLAGAGLGLAGAVGLGRLLRNRIPQVAPEEPATYVGVLLLLLGVAAVACLVPALRAARVPPAEPLRSE